MTAVHQDAKLRVRTFTLNNRKEIISKIVREVLVLFKVETVGRQGETDYLQLSVINHRLPDTEDGRVAIESKIMLFDLAGRATSFVRRSTGALDEREGAAVNRLIKLNLYHIFCEELDMPQAPWGILHGVRPTKIVHRWIRGGMGEEDIIERLQSDYACSEAKARVIVPMAFRQLPFLAQSDEKTVSVYVGIPFCLTRCLYCSFPSNILPGRKRIAEFMTVLEKDLLAAKEAIDHYGFRVQNIYVGGGTPSMLEAGDVSRILKTLRQTFCIASDAEITIEANPDSLDYDKAAALADCGVNRLSLGVQSFSDAMLAFLGRVHTAAQGEAAIQAAYAAGIHNLSMDLMYGLPGQHLADVRRDVERLSQLPVVHASIYSLIVEDGTQLKAGLEKGTWHLPPDGEGRPRCHARLWLPSLRDFQLCQRAFRVAP